MTQALCYLMRVSTRTFLLSPTDLCLPRDSNPFLAFFFLSQPPSFISSSPFSGSAPPPRPLLEVRHLKKYFPVRSGVFSRISGWVKAVDDVFFDIYPGETLGMVGESGCGKTTVGRTVLRLIEPTSGEVRFDNEDVLSLNSSRLREMRRHMQMIFHGI